MNRTVLILTVLFLSLRLGLAQAIAPARIEWQKIYAEAGPSVSIGFERMPDGGYLLGCSSYSGISSNKTTPNYGSADFWVIRLDANGNKMWEVTCGGQEADYLWDANATSDGGVILAGESYSPPSGSKTAPLMAGGSDFWIVRLDANGNQMWDKSFGGTHRDEARAVQQTADGGFLVGGTSMSMESGNKTSPLSGAQDVWVVRVDGQGEKLWERAYGGTGSESLTDLQQTSDQGFILAGDANDDLWVVRIDAAGTKLWDRSFGGTGAEFGCRTLALEDGGFVVGGCTTSDISGNKSTPLQGTYDYWVLRLDADGNKLWEHDFGGTLPDYFADVQQTLDGGFMVAGSGFSEADGNKTAPRLNGYDLWLVRLDSAGTRIWDQTYDGPYNPWGPRLQATSDGGMMMAALFDPHTNAPGLSDIVLYKLSADALTAPELRFASINPPGNGFRLQLAGISNRTYVTEFSSDLQTWSPLVTNQLSSSATEIVDPAPAAAKQFYRARMVE